MALTLPPVPTSVPMYDKQGNMNAKWKLWWDIVYKRIGGATTGFAPDSAAYIVNTPSSGLSAEQALSTLSSGFAKVATGTGVISSTGNVLIQPADLSTTAVTAATYTVNGSNLFTVDANGRLTAAFSPTITAVPEGAAGGDLSGTYPSPSVIQINGVAVGSIAAFNALTGYTASGATGTTSTNLVFSTSPTLVTPLLGTPTSGTLTNCTGYTEANVVFTDITTNDSSTTKHGYLKKLSNVATEYLDGTGAWSTPPGTGTVTSVATAGLATGGPITSTGTVTVTAATQANQEASTSTTTAVTPAIQGYHPSSAKAWVVYTSITTTTIGSSYNVSSLTDNGTGDTTVNIDIDFSSANYASVCSSRDNGSGVGGQCATVTKVAGAVRIETATTLGTGVDSADVSVACFGDLV